MAMTANAAGVACCGSCGAEAHVVCSAGCANPDIEIREHPVSSLPLPRGREKAREKQQTLRSAFCECGKPVAVRQAGRGRPPTRCEKHLAASKVSRDKWLAKRAAK